MRIRSDNISLIGFMGSGKTTIGKMLASQMNKRFIDIDNIIELVKDKKINEIFTIHGEDYFRNIETDVILKIYGNENTVFACGGGIVLRKINMKAVKANSIVVYLKVAPEVVLKRLQKKRSERPIVRNIDDQSVENILNYREDKYRMYSDIIIDSSIQTPEETLSSIIKKIHNYG